MRIKSLAAAVTAGMLGLFTGCGFFPANTTTSGSTPVTGADYVYVVNQTTDSLSGFVVGAGALTSIGTVGLTAGLTPASVAVTRANTFVYVGGNGAVSCYSIGSGGALTAVSGGGAGATANFVSLDTSPDGQWLIGLDSTTFTVYVYAINASTGALTLKSSVAYAAPGSGVVAQRSLKVAPSGGFVAVALGPSGDLLFSFDTSTGTLTGTAGVSLAAGYSDNAVIFDASSGYLIVGRGVTGTTGTSSLATYSVSSTGALAAVQSSVASGSAPYSLALDSTGAHVYAANRGDGTISGYALASGMLTGLAGSPYASGSAVTALVSDNTGKYVVAASSGGAADVTLYSFDAVTAGKLDAVAVAASGTDPAGSVAVAATH